MTDQFTYVSVLLSVVVALALTHLLAGIATLVRVRVTRFSVVYVTWVAVLLFSCVDYIAGAWLWRDARVQGVAIASITALYVYYAVTYIPSL